MLSRASIDGVTTSRAPEAGATKRPSRNPAVLPAAMLSIPIKKSRLALGRSETSATTGTPADFSRMTASRTCGVSVVITATPSKAPSWSVRSSFTMAWGSLPGAVKTRTETRSPAWASQASARASFRVSTNKLGPSGKRKANRYSRCRARLAA